MIIPGTYQASFAALTERDYEMFSSYLVTESEKYNQHQVSNSIKLLSLK